MSHQNRRGSLLIELGVSTALISVLLAISTQAAIQLRRQSAQVSREQVAMWRLENAMERLTAQQWPEIAIEGELIDAIRSEWPAGELTIQIAESSEPVASKRIALQWTPASAASRRALRLTAWVYRSDSSETGN